MENAIKIIEPTLIDQAYATIAHMESVSHNNEIFCILNNRKLTPFYTVGENTCFAFSGVLEPKAGILLNFSENDTHFFNGALSSSKNYDLNLTVSRPGRESNFSFLTPYNALFIHIDEGKFKKLFELLTHRNFEQFFRNDFVRFSNHDAKFAIASRIKFMLAEGSEDPTFLEDLIISIDSTPTLNQRPFCNALAVHANNILRATKSEAVTMTELSTMLNAPARSIQQGFKAVYGKGPIEFHTHYRMQCVRQYLKSHSVSHGELTQIIHLFGFNHQGRFAQNYRKLFGVLPSKEDQFNH
ncbi:MAG: helix-turn-helix domain-containing protein [Akkermansiaceae bacterium]